MVYNFKSKEMQESSVEKYFQEVEEYVISLLSKRLKKISDTEADDMGGLMKLQNIKDDIQAIRKKTDAVSVKAKAEIYAAVESAAREYYKEAAEGAEKDGNGKEKKLTPYEENYKVLAAVERAKKEAIDEFNASIKVEAIGFENADGEFKFLEQAYREAVNGAVKKAAKGTEGEDIEEYIEETLEDLMEQGLVKHG